MGTFKASGKFSRLSDLYSRLDGVFKDHVEEIINVNGSGFYLLRMLRLTKHGIQTPGGLLEALVDTYDMDGHYFKINDHVLNITLEDVLYITGLPIDGREVIIPKTRDDNAFTRVFTDLQTDKMTTICLEGVATNFVENIDEVNSYSWGAAFLATLYVGIEKFKLKLKKRVDGNCWPLLEIRWHVYDEAMLDDDMRLNHLSSVYYAPVINMHAVAHHRPICHLRQFRGLEKYVDLAKYVRWTARNIILKENKGNNNKDLTIFCARWISLWDNREPISKYIKKALNIEDSDEEYEDGFPSNDNFSQHSSPFFQHSSPFPSAPSPQRTYVTSGIFGICFLWLEYDAGVCYSSQVMQIFLGPISTIPNHPPYADIFALSMTIYGRKPGPEGNHEEAKTPKSPSGWKRDSRQVTQGNGPDCQFFAFEDELIMCTCGRGYCRNAQINGRKHWVCGIRDRDACEFCMLITSSGSSSGSITPTLRSSQSHSQSSGSSSGGKRSNAKVQQSEYKYTYLTIPLMISEGLYEMCLRRYGDGEGVRYFAVSYYRERRKNNKNYQGEKLGRKAGHLCGSDVDITEEFEPVEIVELDEGEGDKDEKKQEENVEEEGKPNEDKNLDAEKYCSMIKADFSKMVDCKERIEKMLPEELLTEIKITNLLPEIEIALVNNSRFARLAGSTSMLLDKRKKPTVERYVAAEMRSLFQTNVGASTTSKNNETERESKKIPIETEAQKTPPEEKELQTPLQSKSHDAEGNMSSQPVFSLGLTQEFHDSPTAHQTGKSSDVEMSTLSERVRRYLSN
ncbi:hypothetical protein L1887_18776 [Cichorium endivia]|nr:hypothetical protein L1887_18776 [Cichorium endivia]